MVLSKIDSPESKAVKLIKEFAESNPKIYAVYKGVSVSREYGDGVFFYFLKKTSRYDEDLETLISALDLKLANELDYDCGLMVFPFGFDSKIMKERIY